MVDKLILIVRSVRDRFRQLAMAQGRARGGYRHVIDLRKTVFELPTILYCDGIYNGRSKVEVVGVAKIGLHRTQHILRKIISHLSIARIYRIDLCVDLLGSSVWDFAAVCRVSRVQNYRIYRKRGGVSFYLQDSHNKKVLVYDKWRELQVKRNPLARIFRPDDSLTRFEVQLSGAAVPFKRLSEIHRYAEINLLEDLTFLKLGPATDEQKPMAFLAALGLRSLIDEFGLQAVSKRFSPPVWRSLERRFLISITDSRVPQLNARLSKSIEDWLTSRIRFPRAGGAPEKK